MKFGITQLTQLTVQALDHQAKSLSRKAASQADAEAAGEALYHQVHAEAEKSRAALRVLMRDVMDADHAAKRAGDAAASREHEEKAYAIHQAQAAIDRLLGKYQPQKIAA
jgi:hypothetical protein